jgi:hypothetical protein
MRRIRTIFVIFVILFFLSISCGGQPNVKFNELAFDFGDVKQEEELSHIFTFVNTGTSTLIIEKVKAG